MNMKTLYLILSIFIFVVTCVICFLYLRRRNQMRIETFSIYEEVKRNHKRQRKHRKNKKFKMRKSFIVTFIILPVLAGCGGAAETQTVCSNLQNEEIGIVEEHTITQKGEDVKTLELNYTLNFEKSTLSSEEVQAYMKSMEERYENIEGVTYTSDISEDEFIETITFEITDDMSNQGMLTLLSTYYGVSDGETDAKVIIEYLENKGMTCKQSN